MSSLDSGSCGKRIVGAKKTKCGYEMKIKCPKCQFIFSFDEKTNSAVQFIVVCPKCSQKLKIQKPAETMPVIIQGTTNSETLKTGLAAGSAQLEFSKDMSPEDLVPTKRVRKAQFGFLGWGIVTAVLIVSVVLYLVFFRTTGNFTDPRDGQSYKTVKIGDQVWIAENLNYDAGEGSYCYDNDPAYCRQYGKLYTWETAQRSVPKGWHLPSKDEFEKLLNYLGKKGIPAYQKLIHSGQSGFNVLFRTYWYSNGSSYVERNAYFWTSTNYGYYAWCFKVSNENTEANISFDKKNYGFSVRCVKD